MREEHISEEHDGERALLSGVPDEYLQRDMLENLTSFIANALDEYTASFYRRVYMEIDACTR